MHEQLWDTKKIYLFQMYIDHFAIVKEPGALLYLHLVVQLTFNNRRVSFQPDLQGAPLDVHHHISALDAELHIERDGQLQEKG